MKRTSKKLKVIITGGSRGTGRGISHVLHKAGYEVLAVGQSKKAEFLNPEIKYIQANLSISNGVSKITELVEQERPLILINCLGIERNSIFTEMTKENYNLVMNTNVTCHVELAKAAIPYMVKKKCGRIVFITSVWGNIGTCRRAAYTMSKFALHGLAMSLADEYAKDGIRINCVAPGFVYVDETSIPGRGVKRNKYLANKVPAQRLCQPEEIGKTVEWLISKDSDYISVQVIVVDGGFQNSGSRGEVF